MGALAQAGLIPLNHLRWGEDKGAMARSLDTNASNENLVKAIVFAGTGHLVKAKLPEARFDEVSGGAIKREHEAREVKIFERQGQ
jgi:ATP-dependent RNA helicase DHX57